MLSNSSMKILYLLEEWKDLGVGCCSDYNTNQLFNQKYGSLDAFKQKCLEYANCKFVVHGWNDGNKWCVVISSDATCTKLKSGPNDCGSRGDNGVHSYEFQKGMVALPKINILNENDNC